jgi:hypothetical protein
VVLCMLGPTRHIASLDYSQIESITPILFRGRWFSDLQFTASAQVGMAGRESVDPDEASVATAPAVERMVVHWYGNVEKIGRQLGAHGRVMFVADSAVYVCLPTGGVTRTVPLRKVALAFRAPGGIAQLFEEGGSSLVTRHTSNEDRDAFVASVKSARGAAFGGEVEPLKVQDVATYAFEHTAAGSAPSARADPVIGRAHNPTVPPGIASEFLPDSPRAASLSQSRATSMASIPGPQTSVLRNPFEAQRFSSEELQGYNPLGAQAHPSASAPATVDSRPRDMARAAPNRDGQSHADTAIHRFAAATKSALEIERDNDDATADLDHLHPSLVLQEIHKQLDRNRRQNSMDPADNSPAATVVGMRPGRTRTPERAPGTAAAAPLDRDASRSAQRQQRQVQSAEAMPPATSNPAAPAQPPGLSQSRGSTPRRVRYTDAQTGDPAFDERRRIRDGVLADLEAVAETGMEAVDSAALHALRRKVDLQDRVIADLKHESSTAQVTELRKELEHARGLIADLQTALRSQETTFAEMLRAQEAARSAQAVKSSLDAQLRAVIAERDSLRAEAQNARVEADQIRAEMDSKERQHDTELVKVREAFVQYDANVAQYLEEVRLEHAEAINRLQKEARERELKLRANALRSSPTPHTAEPKRPDLDDSSSRTPAARHADVSSNAVQPDELRDALMRHLNSYANARFHLPVHDPIPAGAPRHLPTIAIPQAGRDRSIL